jgi:hypothetical protein
MRMQPNRKITGLLCLGGMTRELVTLTVRCVGTDPVTSMPASCLRSWAEYVSCHTVDIP